MSKFSEACVLKVFTLMAVHCGFNSIYGRSFCLLEFRFNYFVNIIENLEEKTKRFLQW